MAAVTAFFSATLSAVGPMTTTFIPPDYCSSALLSGCSTGTGANGDKFASCRYIERGNTCGPDGQTLDKACFPGNPDPSSTMLYSPAIACPVGWITDGLYLDNMQQTFAVCCPYEYTIHPTLVESCVKSHDGSESMGTITFCYGGGTLSSTLISFSDYPEYGVTWAHQIRIVLPPSTSDTSSATALREPTPTLNSLNGFPAGGSGSGESSSGKKKTGSRKSDSRVGLIVGIVLGAVAGLVLLGGLIYVWRRKKRQSAVVTKDISSGDQDALPEFMGSNTTTTTPPQMANAASDGLFQPQPAPGSTR